MSDPEVATRAPESDLTEPSAISNTDSTAQVGPSMGEHCTSDRPPPDPSRRPSGQLTKFDDTEVYISKPADYPNTPAKLLLLLSSGTGVHSVNNQIQADIFAQAGFVVIMPDQFGGDPAPNTRTMPDDPSEQREIGILERVKLTVADTAKSFLVDMWLARQTPEKVLPILLKVIETAKDEYADAVEHGGGIYSVGYCFGGKYTILLAGEKAGSDLVGQAAVAKDEEQGSAKKGPLIKAGVAAHATLVTREDLKDVKVPLSLVVVENDPLFPDEVLEEGKKQFATTKLEHQIKTYFGVPHGFAVYGDYESPSIQKSQAEAFQQILSWLESH